MLIAIPFLISTPVNAAPVYERARVVRKSPLRPMGVDDTWEWKAAL
jgi:hypothetical protein